MLSSHAGRIYIKSVKKKSHPCLKKKKKNYKLLRQSTKNKNYFSLTFPGGIVTNECDSRSRPVNKLQSEVGFLPPLILLQKNKNKTKDKLIRSFLTKLPVILYHSRRNSAMGSLYRLCSTGVQWESNQCESPGTLTLMRFQLNLSDSQAG